LNGNPALMTLNRILNSEGYVNNLLKEYGAMYCYNRKDHLGNIREVWQAAGIFPSATGQRTQYYPSGLPWAITTAADYPSMQPYKFNGKQFDEMHGYDTYDYGARGYYAAMGRFTTIDPLAEKHYDISPYAYCSGNPINKIDPDGRSDFEDKDGNFTKHVEDNSNAVYQQTGSDTGLHYTFEYYDSSSGGDYSPNIQTAIQEQQNLNLGNLALQEKVDADGNSTTYCNFSTQNVMKTVESTLDNNASIVVEGKANQMSKDIAKNPNYTEVNEDYASKNAQNGGLSIVTYTNPAPKHSGHVATFSVGDNLDIGEIANIGPKILTGFKSLNQSINPNKPKKFYIFLPNLLPTVTVKAFK